MHLVLIHIYSFEKHYHNFWTNIWKNNFIINVWKACGLEIFIFFLLRFVYNVHNSVNLHIYFLQGLELNPSTWYTQIYQAVQLSYIQDLNNAFQPS